MFIANIAVKEQQTIIKYCTGFRFFEGVISARIYEILMNSYESSIIYDVLGHHLMMGAQSAKFEIQSNIKMS